jgi:hypothetical protein
MGLSMSRIPDSHRQQSKNYSQTGEVDADKLKRYDGAENHDQVVRDSQQVVSRPLFDLHAAE